MIRTAHSGLAVGTAMDQQSQIVELLLRERRSLTTSRLLYDLEVVRENFTAMSAALELVVHDCLQPDKAGGVAAAASQRSRVYYAVKVDPNPFVLKSLVDLGSGFDVASAGEVQAVLNAGGDANRMIFSNTVKIRADIVFAAERGVSLFSADDFSEVDKIAEIAPGSKLNCRILVGQTSSHYPMTTKFGASPQKCVELMIYAKSVGLVPYSVSFHVGSQCYDELSYRQPVEDACWIVSELLTRHGISSVKEINVGGGFPKRYGSSPSSSSSSSSSCPSSRVQKRQHPPELSTIVNVVKDALLEHLPVAIRHSMSIAAEPGRFIVGDAAVLVAQVIGRTQRQGGESWLHLNSGIYCGLGEAAYNIWYETAALMTLPQRQSLTSTDENNPTYTDCQFFLMKEDSANETTLGTFTLTGPTCDNLDVFYRGITLPAAIGEGDLVLFFNAGAYASTCSCSFNGFPGPTVSTFKQRN